MEESMQRDSGLRWGIQHGMWVNDAKTLHEYGLKMWESTMADCVDAVACPTLVVDPEAESKFPVQVRKLYDALKSDKEFMFFTAEDAAEEHCQAGASLLSNQRIFDWLDKTFK